ncbi:MAG: hypothetical protein ACFFCW_16370 [Candidatus Hodarchaeota archaeon]
MSKNTDWLEIERKVFRDTQQDGLMELLSGVGMVYLAGMVAVLIITGLVLFLWFLRTIPLPAKEPDLEKTGNTNT